MPSPIRVINQPQSQQQQEESLAEMLMLSLPAGIPVPPSRVFSQFFADQQLQYRAYLQAFGRG